MCLGLCRNANCVSRRLWFCWKWPAVPFPRYLLTRRVTQLLVGVWPSYLSLRSAGSLTAQTLNSLDNTCHCLSRYTRAWTLCRPRAVIGRQWLSLRSSRQWAWTAQVSPARPVIDRTPTMTVRALRDDAGPQNDADTAGIDVAVQSVSETVRNDVAVPYSGVAAQPVRRHHRWAVGVNAFCQCVGAFFITGTDSYLHTIAKYFPCVCFIALRTLRALPKGGNWSLLDISTASNVLCVHWCLMLCLMQCRPHEETSYNHSHFIAGKRSFFKYLSRSMTRRLPLLSARLAVISPLGQYQIMLFGDRGA